jgi:hypothetical protein
MSVTDFAPDTVLLVYAIVLAAFMLYAFGIAGRKR